MNFDLTEDQKAIRSAVGAVCADFNDDYWLRKDREGGLHRKNGLNGLDGLPAGQAGS